MDYYRCQQRVVADCLETFGRVVKEETGGRCLFGAFYGYFFEVLPQTQAGHLEIERLLSSPVIDYFAAPYGYEWRQMGQDGRLALSRRGVSPGRKGSHGRGRHCAPICIRATRMAACRTSPNRWRPFAASSPRL